MGDDFGGFQDIVPQVLDEETETVLSYIRAIPQDSSGASKAVDPAYERPLYALPAVPANLLSSQSTFGG
jgi:hypothetical protein